MALKDAEYSPEPVVDENGTKHEADIIEVGDPSRWPRISSQYCQVHNLVPDPSETEFEALQCTNCPYHCLVRRKEPVR